MNNRNIYFTKVLFIMFSIVFMVVFLGGVSCCDVSKKPKESNNIPILTPFFYQYQILKPWQVEGIKSAMEDSDPRVWMLAWEKIGEWMKMRYEFDFVFRVYKESAKGRIKNQKLRMDAEYLRNSLSKKAELQLPWLIKDLENNLGSYWRDSLKTLSVIGKPAYKYVDKIGDKLEDSDFFAKIQAIETLGEMGTASSKYSDKILDILKHSDKFTFMPSLVAAKKIGVTDEVIAKAVSVPKLAHQQIIFQLMMHNNEETDLLPVLGIIVKDKKSWLRDIAILKLSLFLENRPEYIPLFEELLNDPDKSYRFLAASALGTLGEKSGKYIPVFLKMIQDKDYQVVCSGLEALGNMGEFADDYSPEVIKLLNHPKTEVRLFAIKALGKIDSKSKKHLDDIGKLIDDEDPIIRSYAVQTLGVYGEDAAVYIPELKQLLNSKEMDEFFTSESKDNRIYFKYNYPSNSRYSQYKTIEVFKNSGCMMGSITINHIYCSIVEAYGNIGEKAIPQIPHVIDMIKRDLSEYRETKNLKDISSERLYCKSIYFLGKLFQQKKEKSIELVQMLQDENPFVRLNALYIVRSLRNTSNLYENETVSLLNDKHHYLRLSALIALNEMNEISRETIPKIEKRLNDSNIDVRFVAFKVLSKYDPGYKKNIPGLVKELNWQNSYASEGDIYKTLWEAGPLNHRDILPILNQNLYDPENPFPRLRFLAHYLAGNDPKGRIVIRWLGRPYKYPDPSKISMKEAVKTLSTFDETWDDSRSYKKLHQELINQSMRIIRGKKDVFRSEDRDLLKRIARKLKREKKKSYYREVKEVVDSLKLSYSDKTIDKEKPEKYILRGSEFYVRGKYDLAIREYKKALEIDPDNAEIYVKLGKAYYLKFEYRNAIDNFNKAGEIDPEYSDSYYKMVNNNSEISKRARKSDPFRVFFEAIEENETAKIKQLASKYPFLIKTRYINGQLPIHLAILQNRTDLLDFFLKNGSDVDAKDKKGNTPLYIAALFYNEEAMDLLISRGADIDYKFENDGGSMLLRAIRSDDIKLVKLLISKGADVNFVNQKYGYTPLLLAASQGSIEIIDLLISNKANTNYRINGRTPLSLAVRNGYIKTVKLLLSRGAKVNEKDVNGETLLHEAAGFGLLDICIQLINYGADIDPKDNKGDTPLHRAARECYPKVFALLLSKGAKVEEKNREGETPLHWAVYNVFKSKDDIIETITILTSNGANINAKTNNGKTPLDLVYKRPWLYKLLKIHGAEHGSKQK